jgi:plasmid stability protein
MQYRNFNQGLGASLQIRAADFHEPTQYSIAIGCCQLLKAAS